MTHVNNTHRFFKENVYSHLVDFALSPISWAYQAEPCGIIALPNLGKLLLAALLSPLLFPAIVITSAIALCLAAVSAVFHGLSLMGAGIADACSNTPVPSI